MYTHSFGSVESYLGLDSLASESGLESGSISGADIELHSTSDCSDSDLSQDHDNEEVRVGERVGEGWEGGSDGVGDTFRNTELSALMRSAVGDVYRSVGGTTHTDLLGARSEVKRAIGHSTAILGASDESSSSDSSSSSSSSSSSRSSSSSKGVSPDEYESYESDDFNTQRGLRKTQREVQPTYAPLANPPSSSSTASAAGYAMVARVAPHYVDREEGTDDELDRYENQYSY